MENNSFKIKITQTEFMAKPVQEQTWLIFEGISHINKDGCEWARKTYGSSFWKKFYIFAAGFGGMILFGIAVLKWLL